MWQKKLHEALLRKLAKNSPKRWLKKGVIKYNETNPETASSQQNTSPGSLVARCNDKTVSNFSEAALKNFPLWIYETMFRTPRYLEKCKMVKSLDSIPWNKRQWGHTLARNAINSKQKLGLGYKQRQRRWISYWRNELGSIEPLFKNISFYARSNAAIKSCYFLVFSCSLHFDSFCGKK